MAKRGNGEGSIYFRQSDKKWVGSVTLQNGKRKVFYGGTRKEVADKLKTALHEQQQGTIVMSSTQTVAQFLTDWLENVHRRRLRPRTYERYSEVINLHLIPALGRYQLQKLTAQHIQKFYTQKEDEGLASTTIHYYHSVLHNALNMAVKWGLVAKNVSDLVTPPRKERYAIQPFTEEQARAFLDVIHGHKWEALFTLALATGMRRGELIGLKWQDINFKTGTLQVVRVLTRVPTKMPEREHVYIEAEPRTEKSRRSVLLAPFVIEALKEHRVRQLEAKLKAGSGWQDRDYVFCTLHGSHLNPNRIVDEFKKLLKQADLPNIRFHDLRHSAASLLLSLGIHPKVVQELLGHTQIGITMDVYSHLLPGMQKDAMSKLDEALKKKKGGEKQESS
jgi:integrase